MKIADSIVFYDLGTLKELLEIVDKKLDELERIIEESSDPDSFGLFDSYEAVAGLGFVTCQWFLTTGYGWLEIDKKVALTVGPMHSSGLTVVQIINHAANYWKHQEEWALKKNEKDARRIMSALSKLGNGCDGEYALSCVLANLAGPNRFEILIPHLKDWCDELSAMKP